MGYKYCIEQQENLVFQRRQQCPCAKTELTYKFKAWIRFEPCDLTYHNFIPQTNNLLNVLNAVLSFLDRISCFRANRILNDYVTFKFCIKTIVVLFCIIIIWSWKNDTLEKKPVTIEKSLFVKRSCPFQLQQILHWTERRDRVCKFGLLRFYAKENEKVNTKFEAHQKSKFPNWLAQIRNMWERL